MAKKITLESIRQKLYTTNEYGVSYQDPEARLSQEEAEFMHQKHGVRTDWHPTCVSCQSRQVIKYPGQTLQLPCKGIPQGLGKGSIEKRDMLAAKAGISKERATKLMLSTIDPVAWAEIFFGFDDKKKGWKLRAYQKEQLRCTTNRYSIREGRRSGKTFIACLKMLEAAFNRQVQAGYDPETGKPIYTGPTIMVVTPFQSQLINIFDELEKLVKLNKELTRKITTSNGGGLYVKTPFFHMDMDNGAVIKGFVSGTGTKSDGSGGGTMRGQSAHFVYLDEMDMIPDDILDKVVKPILLSDQDGNITLLATSTPIGKRARFYNWCKKDPEFKEDHLPSTVLPQWDKIKGILENEGTKESFLAEYMAEFIETGHGVFKPSWVYGSRQPYTYEEIKNNLWWNQRGVFNPKDLVYCLGIDWNKNAGTEYVVVATDVSTPKWKTWVVDAVNVEASDFSARAWKDEVVRLNHKWQPSFIYADEGYGHTIIEDLRLESLRYRGHAKTPVQVSTSKIMDRLKSLNFSSKIEMRSPIDQQPISKMAKSFLVENLIRAFETNSIVMSEHDNVLKAQLLDYVIVKMSANGKPVYGASTRTVGDHRLDALMLAIGGIQLELGTYSDTQAIASSTPSYISDEELKSRAAGGSGLGLKSLFRKFGITGSGNSRVDAILPRRQGETEDEAFLRHQLEAASQTSFKPRSRSNMGDDHTVYGHFNKSAGAPSSLYETDREHTWQGHSSPSIVNKRKSRSGRSKLFGKKKRR